MVSWTKLLTGVSQEHANLRYSQNNGCVPKIVVWNITKQCNLYCRHCYFEAVRNPRASHLTHKEAEDFIEDLARFNVGVLLFSGGEPILRKDIFALGKFAKDKGVRPVLSTNGTLITTEVAKKIKAGGFSYVGISLDGVEETNDLFRQKKGAYQAALNGIRNCQQAGLKVGLRFTLTKHNFQDLPAIFDLLEKENIPRVCFYHLVYTGKARNLIEEDLSSKQKIEASELFFKKTLYFQENNLKIELLTVDNHADGVWIYLRFKKSDSQHAQKVLKLLEIQGGNGSGISMAAVDNQGDIFADQFLRSQPLGNIRKRKFSEVWKDKDSVFLQALRNRKPWLKGRCSRCNFLTICNGNFRARAEAVFGDPWQEDPACYLTDKEISGDA